jgi:hypothetical protein
MMTAAEESTISKQQKNAKMQKWECPRHNDYYYQQLHLPAYFRNSTALVIQTCYKI